MDSDEDYSSNEQMNDSDDIYGESSCDEQRNDENASIYTILKEKDVINRLDDYVVKVSSCLSVSREDAILLLRHHNWNVEGVYEEWFANEEKLRTTLGLRDTPILKDISGSKKVSCRICLDNYKFDVMKSLVCGHLFCVTCWEGYISSSIKDGPGCLTLKCPMPKCEIPVKQDFITMFASKRDYIKFEQHVVESYIQVNKKIKWCPAPNCVNAIKHDSGNYNVTCNCTHSFCWNCTDEDHRPVNCETVMKWNKKNSCESENANWILAYTKPCPKCNRSIEKNHGCMHMTCRPPCGHEFCWTCLGDYKGHRTCNKFNEVDNNGIEDRRIMAKNLIERYLHYFERWSANHSSREKARLSLKQVETYQINKINNLFSNVDGKFIIEAWNQIIECRRVLKWTYAYGYYLPEEEKTKKRFFEYLQGEAEMNLERLHGCAEREVEEYLKEVTPLTKDDFIKFRAKVTGLTKVTRTFFENLVKALENDLVDVTSQKSSGKKSSGGAESSSYIERARIIERVKRVKRF